MLNSYDYLSPNLAQLHTDYGALHFNALLIHTHTAQCKIPNYLRNVIVLVLRNIVVKRYPNLDILHRNRLI